MQTIATDSDTRIDNKDANITHQAYIDKGTTAVVATVRPEK